MLLQLFSIFSFAFLWIAVARIGSMRPTYFLGFLIFFSIQYGPHTAVLPQFFEISKIADIPNAAHDYYVIVTSLCYLILASLIATTPPSVLRCKNRFGDHPDKPRGQGLRITIPAIALIAISLSLPHSINIISEHFSYFVGSSNYSYTDIRRDVFQGTTWSSFANAVRFAVIPLIGGGALLAALTVKSTAKKTFFFLLSALLPLLTSIQLNKLFYAYYLLLYAYIYQCSRRGVPSFSAQLARFSRDLWKIFLALCIGGFVLLALYYFQYSDSINDGTSNTATLIKTLVYRVFFASADGLAAWINYFILVSEPIGLAGSGKLCTLLLSDCIDIPLFTAIEIIGSDKTSIQTGFMGSGISSFGLIGLILYLLVAYGAVFFNNATLLRFQNSHYFPVLSGAMFLNSFFLTTVPTHTAMLSGGAILTPLVALIIFGPFKRRRTQPLKAHRGTGSLKAFDKNIQ
ncbi:hypothetical protein [Thauera sp. WH-1]|uniref:hypothetical protein n=1 Tax=Thauera sp. WH-1 TaxID=3398230 RepID=UPI0039FD0563